MSADMALLCASQVVIVLITTILQMLTPRLTRRDIWFSVTVSPEFRDTPEARAVAGRYRLITGVEGVAALAIVVASWFAKDPMLGVCGTLLQMVLAVPAFLYARRRTLPHAVVPSTVREVALTRPNDSTTGIALLHAGPLVILSAMAVWLVAHWGELPERRPLHRNALGQVDHLGPKDLQMAFGPVLIGLAVCALLWWVSAAIGRTRRVSASGVAAENERRYRRTMRGMPLVTAYLIAVNNTLVTMVTVCHQEWLASALPIVVLVFVLVMVVLTRVGQGGNRFADQPSGTSIGDRTPDSRWKWGKFYVNPDDPALFVENRFGIGYTFNYGHVGSWLYIGGTLLVPGVIWFLLGKAGR